MEKEQIKIYKKVKTFTFEERGKLECVVNNWVELQDVIQSHKNGLFIDFDGKNIDSRKLSDEKAKELFNHIYKYQNK